MRKLALVVICFSVATLNSTLFSQEDTLSIRKSEFGFNCVPFISNLLPFDESITASSSDILLIYKRKLNQNNLFLRTGMQLSYVSESNEQDAALLNFRIGLEKKKYVSKRWIFNSGAEVFTSLRSPRLRQLDRGEFGIAGLVGFQFMINERMGLGTEGYITFSYVEVNASGSSQDLTGINSGISLPRSLFFSVYF